MVGWTLQEIRDEFESEYIPCRLDYDPGLSGERRTLVEQYYTTLDFTQWNDVQKLIRVYESILNTLEHHDLKAVERLRLYLQRDGFEYKNGQISGIPGNNQNMYASNSSDMGTVAVPSSAIERIWGKQGFRLFLSHKTDVKEETALLKDRLRLFGIVGFVAHEDIHPTKAWQDEIEYALSSMDGFVALMTENFHDSNWTDQEVGFAVARRVPIIAVRMGTDPYGFIGKFQALSCTWMKAPIEIVKLLINDRRVFDGYIQALRNVPNWDVGNELAEVLPSIETLTQQQINALVAAYNETAELRGSFGFNGKNKTNYGPGLVWHLNKLGTANFVFSNSGLIEEIIPF